MKNKPLRILLYVFIFLLVIGIIIAFLYIKTGLIKNILNTVGKKTGVENIIETKPTVESVSAVLQESQKEKVVTQKELDTIQKVLEGDKKNTQIVNKATSSTNSIDNSLLEQKSAQIRADITKILSNEN